MYFDPEGFVELLERNADRLRRFRPIAFGALLLSLLLGHMCGWAMGPLSLVIYGFISLSMFVIVSPLIFGAPVSGVSIYKRTNQLNRLYLLIVSQIMYLGSALIIVGPIAWVIKVV